MNVSDFPIAPPTRPMLGQAGDDGTRELPPTVDVHQPCIRCGYDLIALGTGGSCPECGTPIERSMRGDLLRFSAPEYLAGVHRGVFLVQTAIIVTIIGAVVLIFGSIVLSALTSGAPAGGGAVAVGRLSFTESMLSILALIPTAMSLWGWWLISSPDPGQLSTNTGQTPRRIIRITTAIGAAFMLMDVVFSLLADVGGPSAEHGPLAILSMIGSVAAIVAWCVQYFASMLYIKWLSPRLPSKRIHNRAKLMLWLGPVLYVVGAAACGIGPLIALILYYNLLEWLRIDLKSIRRGGVARLA